MDDFELDDDKSQANLEKHGIDFHAAQELWKDPDLLEIQANSESERRFLVVGRISDKHWSAIATLRNEKIRIISVRRSRNKEVELYESEGI